MTSTSFTKQLLKWHSSIDRKLPWKKTKDPYKIWLSEIILQQTRVEQGIPYYLRMTRLFPSVKKLAGASEDRVLHAWQGLRYYSRARNLHAAARQIAFERKGKFPDTFEEILRMKGVGQYTAAAIASFAFNLPHAAVDGNVYRVLSRAFGITDEVSSAGAKRKFNELANQLLDRKNPGAFNQALMDFGALVCKPLNPDCEHCFFKKSCYALKHDLVSVLPRKDKKQVIRTRWFHFLVFERDNLIAIQKRSANDIWKGLYQFPLIEHTYPLSQAAITSLKVRAHIPGKPAFSVLSTSPQMVHKLSHQTIKARFFKVRLKGNWRPRSSPHLLWIPRSELKKYALPKLIVEYSKKYLA